MKLADLAGAIGKPLATSGWITVDAERIALFAEATGDRQWIHVDPVRAAMGPFGGIVAHGFLTLSLLSALAAEAVRIEDSPMAVNYGLNRVRFPAPVPAGRRVRAHFALRSVAAAEGGLQVVLDARVECEGVEKPVCVAEFVVRHFLPPGAVDLAALAAAIAAAAQPADGEPR